jgi:hypothetical protein
MYYTNNIFLGVSTGEGRGFLSFVGFACLVFLSLGEFSGVDVGVSLPYV